MTTSTTLGFVLHVYEGVIEFVIADAHEQIFESTHVVPDAKDHFEIANIQHLQMPQGRCTSPV